MKTSHVPASMSTSSRVTATTVAVQVNAVVALVLGHAYMACSFGFLHRRTDGSARRLLWASLVYLPALFAALLFL